MKHQFITGHYNQDRSVTFYTRNEREVRDELKVIGFNPFFFVDKFITVPDHPALVSIVEKDFKGIYGRYLKKLIMETPTDVGGDKRNKKGFREKFENHWEGDIDYIRRILVTAMIKAGFIAPDRRVVHYTDLVPCDFTLPPVMCFWDIETYTRGRFPDIYKAIERVTCVTVYDTIYKTYITFLLDDKNKKVRLADNWILYCINKELRIFSLLEQYLLKTLPDVLAEWGNFDEVYSKNRGKRFRVYLPFNKMCVFDLSKGYKKLYKKGSNRLKDVVFDEGITNEIEPEVNYAWLYDNDKMRLVRRNKRHVEWLVKLNEKKHNLIRFYWNLKNLSGLEDLKETLYHGVLVDTLMLRKYNGRYVLPSKKYFKKERSLLGALVKKPPIGIFDDVVVLDFSRYYPNIMIAYGLTPEEIPEGSDEIGGATELCQELLDEREIYEKQLSALEIDTDEYNGMKSIRDSVKYIGEAVIGYFGSTSSRLYSPPIFEKVTGTGQKGLLVLDKACIRLGYRVIYYDTDGIFIKVQSLDEALKLVPILNKVMSDWGKKEGIDRDLKLKIDRYFGKREDMIAGGVLFKGVKKRYAGRVIWEDNKDVDYLLIKGFDYIRRESSLLTRRIQRELFECLLKKGTEGLVGFIRDIVVGMRKERFSLREVSLRKTTRKAKFKDYKIDIDYIRGIRYSNEHFGMDIRTGDTVKMLYVKHIPHHPLTDVICFMDEADLPVKPVVDWSKMIDRTIKRKVEDLIALGGIDWKTIEGYTDLSEDYI